METKKIKREEIRRLIKAVKAGKKEYLAEWISQFDEQIRFEYSKQLEEIIKKSSQELQEKYERQFKEELSEAIENYLVAIVYTLKFSELTKFGPKRINEFMEDVSATIDGFKTNEYSPKEYKEILKENKVELSVIERK